MRFDAGLPLWGLFMVAVCALAMGVLGVGVTGNALITSVLGLGFILVWLLGRSNAHRQRLALQVSIGPVPESTDTIPDSCAPAATSSEHDDCPASEPALSHHDSAWPSRWTSTFGPPETGQLPVQRYVTRTLMEESGGKSPGSDLLQWSHARS
ncbi:hypothetical protein [Arthrobacter sp. H5]|uniref:hypothetical protein n=1 Tax=Arthrobacter sp. H5 TaxID=1267973 RepID=UPI0004859B32|nr:hypothetical protein [Arthrobacter sp. H5]